MKRANLGIRKPVQHVIGRIFIFVMGMAGLAMTPVQGQTIYKPIEGEPIRIDGGLISGSYLPSGVKAWFGVPFAAPPVRENRWREPQPVKPWNGVLTTNRMPPECMQNLRSSNTNHYFGEEAASEDCLYLNMWAPKQARPGARLPVVVWIYGGAFTGGSSGMALYGGESLARKGVLYVALNYRVGLFGYLAHSEASAESGHQVSGNFGFLDQVAALKWIRRNIEKFGGDSGNVTLIGQSAGSMSINALQASPLSRGLLHKAVGLSGSMITGPASEIFTLADGEEQGRRLQAALNASSLVQMRSFPADKIMAAGLAAKVRTFPSIDGYFLPKPVAAIFAAGEQSDIPILVGSTANDSSTNPEIRRAATLTEYRALARKMYGPDADELLRLYPASTDNEARAAAERVGLNSGIGADAPTWARTQTEHGKAPAYLYRFSRVHPYAPGVAFADHDPVKAGAYHGGDIPYWLMTQDTFNLFRITRNWTAADRQLAEKMSDILVRFARTGDPGTEAVKMPRYDLDNPQFVNFGNSIQLEKLNSQGVAFIASHAAPVAAAATNNLLAPAGTPASRNVPAAP